MVQVESDLIDEIGYNPEQATLFVRFAHGGWYRYFAVPRRIYEDLVAAESKGRFFREYIRNLYPYRKGR
jgi:KTSC domain-containing protein